MYSQHIAGREVIYISTASMLRYKNSTNNILSASEVVSEVAVYMYNLKLCKLTALPR